VTSRTFGSLRNFNYRLYAAGQLVSNSGTWMQRATQSWLVLQLTGGDATAVGITTGLQFTPLLFLGLWGGVIADRYPKRRLLIITQTAMGVQALTLGLLVVSGHAQVWHVYALAFAMGLATVVDNPVRQSFVIEMVGPEQLGNAVALNSATMNAARLFGPALAGFLITAIDTGPVFLVNAVSYAAVIAGLSLMREHELHPVERAARGRRQLREGLRQVRTRPDLRRILLLVAVAATFGQNFQVTIALMAGNVFRTGAGSYGVLFTALGVGALAGALLAARRREQSNGLLILSTAGFGACVLLAGLAPSYWTFMIVLVPAGLTWLTLTTSANTLIQLSIAPAMRGRVMALYLLALHGGTPFGAPLVGVVSGAFGTRYGLIVGGLVPLAVAVTVGVRYVLARRATRAEPVTAPGVPLSDVPARD